ncbi:MAG: N-acetylmuramidase domain-containing protein [Mesorhizobium sp.]
MFDRDVTAAIEKVAAEAGVEEAALLAVAEVESGGRAFALVEGRREPLIRFEGHYFDRRLSGQPRERARAQGLASPKAGAIPNPRSQAARWALVERAAVIDRDAAWESVSWGLGQVMGAHWAWLGYASPAEMVAEARSGVEGQTRQMLRFIDKAGLLDALRRRDWPAFARGYNGPAYRRNAYDTRLAAAYARHAGKSKPPTPPEGNARAAFPKRGSEGDAVRTLQRRLAALGHPLQCDGLFGAATEAAVKAFQRRSKLSPDGIAGPRTLAAIATAEARQSEASLWRRMLSAIDAWLRRD